MTAAATLRLQPNDDVTEPVEAVRAIPAQGASHEQLLRQLQTLRADDTNWRTGRCFSLVYHASDEHSAFLKDASNAFFSENGLNPMAFKSLKRMEHEVVRMAASLMNGNDDVVGTMTSGGTESLLLAMKTYRDLARKTKPWVLSPEVVLPATAHVAFDKASHYFGIKIRWAPIGPDFRVDVNAVRRLINRNTVMIAGSAPQYPHGVVDPIEALAALAVEKKIPMHVDACVGGFVLPFIEKLGHFVPRWDFRVPGVTSISADLHKYGYTAKGASVILYRNMDYLKHQFFVSTDWPGGIYASPSIPGTRSGGPIAAAWGGLQAMGVDGYCQLTDKALKACDKLKAGISQIDGLKIIGSEHTTIVTWTSSVPEADVYAIADQLEDMGWHVDRQQHPACVHLTVTANHLAIVDDYVRDLARATSFVKANPEVKSRGNAAMYGMMAKVPIRAMVKSAVQKVMEEMYGKDGNMDLSSAQGSGPLDRFIANNQEQVMKAFDVVEDVAGAAISRVKRFRGLR
ncbi:MAG: aspartate aminotransferase family protein [Deltaproteobacteria bacterium]|nr:aspartate aminotransferase family protein [Deltaproteobacteria bacterium]